MRAAVYVRQSLDKKREGAAVARQLEACRELTAQRGWTIEKVFSDNDVSASSAKRPRPEWQALLSELRDGRYDVLVCWSTDRLYRRLRDLVELVEIAEARSLRIATVKSSDVDLSTPAGRMLAGMLGSAARFEVEQKGARQVAANRQRAQQGVSLWTRRPYGFDRNGSKVVIVKSEAAVIRKAARQVLAGETLTSVATGLNASGKHNSQGEPWSVTTLKRTLLSPRVAGRVTYNGEDMGPSGLAILDVDTADRLSALLKDPRRRYAPSTTTKYLLSGIARCGRDGCDLGVMFATTNSDVMVYRCRSCYLTRRLDLVDEVVIAAVVARLSRPDAAEVLFSDNDVSDLQERVVERRERRDGLAVLLADGLLSPEAVREQAQRLTREIDDLERQIDAGMGEHPATKLIGSKTVETVFEKLSLADRREVIKTLTHVIIMPAGKGVRFSPEQVRIDWRGAQQP